MAIPRRTVDPQPPTRGARRHGRGVLATLAGGLAGLAAAVVSVAWAPEVGRDAMPGAAKVSSSAQGGDRSRERLGGGVAMVLAPATEAGVAPVRQSHGEGVAP